MIFRTTDTFTKKRVDAFYPAGEKPLTICHASHINVHALMTYDYLIVDKEAVEVLEEMYQ